MASQIQCLLTNFFLLGTHYQTGYVYYKALKVPITDMLKQNGEDVYVKAYVYLPPENFNLLLQTFPDETHELLNGLFQSSNASYKEEQIYTRVLPFLEDEGSAGNVSINFLNNDLKSKPIDEENLMFNFPRFEGIVRTSLDILQKYDTASFDIGDKFKYSIFLRKTDDASEGGQTDTSSFVKLWKGIQHKIFKTEEIKVGDNKPIEINLEKYFDLFGLLDFYEKYVDTIERKDIFYNNFLIRVIPTMPILSPREVNGLTLPPKQGNIEEIMIKTNRAKMLNDNRNAILTIPDYIYQSINSVPEQTYIFSIIFQTIYLFYILKKIMLQNNDISIDNLFLYDQGSEFLLQTEIHFPDEKEPKTLSIKSRYIVKIGSWTKSTIDQTSELAHFLNKDNSLLEQGLYAPFSDIDYYSFACFIYNSDKLKNCDQTTTKLCEEIYLLMTKGILNEEKNIHEKLNVYLQGNCYGGTPQQLILPPDKMIEFFNPPDSLGYLVDFYFSPQLPQEEPVLPSPDSREGDPKNNNKSRVFPTDVPSVQVPQNYPPYAPPPQPQPLQVEEAEQPQPQPQPPPNYAPPPYAPLPYAPPPPPNYAPQPQPQPQVDEVEQPQPQPQPQPQVDEVEQPQPQPQPQSQRLEPPPLLSASNFVGKM